MLAQPLVPVLVTGPASTPADVKALRALAYNIAYELGRAVTWATGTDHDVRDYAAVYTTCPVTELSTDPALLLVGEALAAGVDVGEPLSADEVVECPCGLVGRHTRIPVGEDGEPHCNECRGADVCGWCGESLEDDATLVERGTAFYPLHPACAAESFPTTGRTLVDVA
ncbi:hypothetical protein [Streptomyces hilarionis]|uniref:hypothetical protein n=1 Tax=Streptomyces hilarionis TaxID=2839954 RepID=UPI00211A533D|nr:hypothetical protein [Streptomyces hilarionis]MCQ9134129.1 hypothetical protein [Streptomyces hilarionis]